MVKKGIILLACIIMTNLIHGQVSQNSNIRPPFDLKLFVNDSVFYEAPMKASRYIINDTIIQIFPGEKLYVESEIQNNKLVNFKVVPKITDKNRTMVIEFHQEKKGKNHDQMILTIENPYQKNLHYSAMINLMNEHRWRKTSVVQVLPGQKSIEMWSDIITSIALSGFEFIEEQIIN
jgi:hypothetical protein